MAELEHNGTEEPTPRRREEARREGQVVQSPDLTAAAGLLTACFLLLLLGDDLAGRLLQGLRQWMTEIPAEDWQAWHVTAGAHWLSAELLLSCGFLVLGLLAVGLAASLLQVGFVVSLKPLEADWSRLLPSQGWARVWSLESGFRGLQGALKVSLLMLSSCLMLWLKRDALSAANFSSVADLAAFAWQLGLTICLTMAGIALALALTDYLVKWLRHEQKLKMTREEIKQEQKDDSGDPQVRAAVRRRQREARRQQSVRDVPKATVILTNPTHLAVALQYEQGMAAPRVVAKGAGVFAKNIVRIAREHQIPVLERKPLARAIFAGVSVGQEIPVEFFRAVAEIIAQIYRARQAAV